MKDNSANVTFVKLSIGRSCARLRAPAGVQHTHVDPVVLPARRQLRWRERAASDGTRAPRAALAPRNPPGPTVGGAGVGLMTRV